MMRSTVLLALIPTILHASAAAAADWNGMPAASRLEFVATYQKQQVPGEFHRFNVRLAMEPNNPPASRLEVTVFTQSADMRSTDINRTILKPDWFDAERYPSARFESTGIAAEAENHYLAKGTLTLKGVQREVTVPFTWRESGQSANMLGELSLNRADFGIGIGDWAKDDPIGLKITVRFTLKLDRSR